MAKLETLKATSLSNSPLEHLVVDTGAFLRNTRLDTLARNIYITDGVVKEIRDARARQNASLMIDLPEVRHPSSKHLQRTKEFARLSGDLKALSATDLQVIALTLMITEEKGDASSVRDSPPTIEYAQEFTTAFDWAPTTNLEEPNTATEQIGNLSSMEDTQDTFKEGSQDASKENSQDNSKEHSQNSTKEDSNTQIDSDDEGEWITSENIHRIGQGSKTVNNLQVACLSTDYTIQNVLIKMGLNIISIDGYQITQTKQWIMKCTGCHHIDYDANLMFCSRCGNYTLVRMSVTTDSSGRSFIHPSKKKQNLRGTIYTIPKPKNKRDIILSEDQLFMNGRDREMRHKTKLWEKAMSSNDPFRDGSIINQQGWWHRVYTHSGQPEIKGAPRTVIGLGKGNPNSNRWTKKYKNKK